jgi:4-amino-4-deoxy-L-arabinose transferase
MTVKVKCTSCPTGRLKRPDGALYNTIGELKYGLAYPHAIQQRARRSGSMGVVMRVKGEDALLEIECLPKDGKL